MECTESHAGLAEDWDLLVTFLPANWRELAAETGALKGLRKDKSVDNLLRVLLIHLGCGYSLRETALRARQAKLAELTAAAVWHRLRKAGDWLHALCRELWREAGVGLAAYEGVQFRAVDATTVKEPGRTGSRWRLHYSVRLPSLACDFFQLTATQGAGTGESFRQFPVQPGDCLLADRGYSTTKGLLHVERAGGRATVRVNASPPPFLTPENGRFDLLAAVKGLRCAGKVVSWPVQVVTKAGDAVAGRVCAARKTQQAIRITHKALHRQASKNGTQLQPQTLELAKYVILFTTFPAAAFPAATVLDWYRTRWQVELVFKRFKSLAQLGHLPKRDDESAKA